MTPTKPTTPNPVNQQWNWSPSLESQLESKVTALSDIAELADQIKDAEVFRRFAKKIAKEHAVMLATISLQVPRTLTRKIRRKK